MSTHRSTLIALLGLTCATAAIVGCVWAGNQPAGNKTTTIDAAKFVSIYDDQGVIYQKNNFTDATESAYNRILRHTTQAGYSNVLLVQGKDFERALLNTDRILFGHQQAEPVHLDAGADCWLYVSLGSGLVCNRGVGSVQIDRQNRVITFEYGPDSADHTEIFRGYAYWVPLGGLEKGEYTLNLFPKGGKRPTLTRVLNLREL